MNRVFIKTYGCQMNERDSEAVAFKLKARGYEIVSDEAIADVVLLNTCSVRDQAEQKAIGKAGHLAHRKKKNQKFIFGVMGCMAQNKGEELFDILPDLDLVVGTQKFHRIPEYLEKITGSAESRPTNIIDLEEEEFSQEEIRDHLNTSQNKVTAFVSIMQGCNMNCTFCIVPKTRGKERYRSIESITKEVQGLVERGVREVTLLGQIVNAYGRGFLPRIDNKSPFVQLLEKLNEIDGLYRIRFTSPHPTSFGDDLIECFASLPKLCEHAHLPMQSGSDRILKLMNRPYSIKRFLDITKKLRTAHSKMRISTDVILGFPSESDEDYALTKSAFIEAAFEMAYIFKYSERSGTPAVELSDSVPKDVKEIRNQDLLSQLEKQSYASNSISIGKKYEVLVEGKAKRGKSMLIGRSRCNRRVVFEGNQALAGKLLDIEIKDVSATTLIGKNCL
ncbi:MAG: tRNA (N6-isopentenyl adenosine(37)-C2)-methylthiotransferase MiaB [Opitutales bacterium]|nr:tRNA (N6-isopentenyl adenosine(37)-C2)-methylthiotransferase MiaB [Opitutales bacterium]